LGFFARTQKMVAGADYHYASFVGVFDIFYAVQRGCPVYLYLILRPTPKPKGWFGVNLCLRRFDEKDTVCNFYYCFI